MEGVFQGSVFHTGDFKVHSLYILFICLFQISLVQDWLFHFIECEEEDLISCRQLFTFGFNVWSSRNVS